MTPAQRIAEIEDRCKKATEGPWSACRKGKCQCKQVWFADAPIAHVTSGNWGDDYPTLRMVPGTGDLDAKVEAVMEQITYGSIPEEDAAANAEFIAHARDDIPFLLDIIASLTPEVPA